MAFLRKKKVGGHQYFYWVEGYVEDGQQKQRTLAYLGKGEEAIARAYTENLPESVIQKIKDSFILPQVHYMIVKFLPDGTTENYYRNDWGDDFMQRH
jgi:hypothetical protein